MLFNSAYQTTSQPGLERGQARVNFGINGFTRVAWSELTKHGLNLELHLGLNL